MTVSVFRFKTDRFAVCRFETDRFETVRFAVLNFRFNRFRFDRFAVLPFSVSVSTICVLHRFDSVLIPFWQDSILAPFCRFRFDSVLQMSVLMSVLCVIWAQVTCLLDWISLFEKTLLSDETY